MNRIEMDELAGPIGDYVREMEHDPVIITRSGTPYAVIVPYDDLKTALKLRHSTALVPKPGERLLDYLRRVEAKYKQEGGISLGLVSIEFGLED
jgi:prevent-host-death family protein